MPFARCPRCGQAVEVHGGKYDPHRRPDGGNRCQGSAQPVPEAQGGAAAERLEARANADANETSSSG